MALFSRRHVREDLAYWRRRLAGRVRWRIKPPLRLRNAAYFLAAVLAAGIAVAVLSQSALPREAVLMAGIFVLAALLWVTEALPPFATAILVMGLEIVLLANPGGWRGLGFEAGASPDYRMFLAPISDPIIVLFLGGFLMAQAAIKEGVDHALAGVILHLFRGRPRSVMLGLMLVTAGLSMHAPSACGLPTSSTACRRPWSRSSRRWPSPRRGCSGARTTTASNGTS